MEKITTIGLDIAKHVLLPPNDRTRSGLGLICDELAG